MTFFKKLNKNQRKRGEKIDSFQKIKLVSC